MAEHGSSAVFEAGRAGPKERHPRIAFLPFLLPRKMSERQNAMRSASRQTVTMADPYVEMHSKKNLVIILGF